jgi:cell wall-active antibiotic response 4TMS protein YvqF
LEGPFIVRVRRGLLFWGLFLIPLGVVPLLVRAGALDPDVVANAWRLWPLLLVAFGLTMILGRSRAGILGTVVAALALGTVAGGALAAGTPWIGNVSGCGSTGSQGDQRLEQGGSFAAPAAIEFDINCGSIDVGMQPGSDWQVTASYRGEPPRLESAVDSLSLHSPDGFGDRAGTWQVDLPTDQTSDIDITANAATGTIALGGATLATFKADLNAGDLRVDLSEGRVSTIDIAVNAGRVRIRAEGDLRGQLSANAGSLELCVPPDAALRIRVEEQLTFGHNLDERGLTRTGDVWTRDGSPSGGLVDLAIEGNAANLSLDPGGGC